MKDRLLERFLKYVRVNTRSDANSNTIPSTPNQLDLLNIIKDELEIMGMSEVKMYESGIVFATLPSNIDKEVPTIGFIAHVDTADFNAEGIKPKIVENYDGQDIVLNEDLEIVTRVSMFPSLTNHVGKTLVVTDGTTLLGADDKAGVTEIMQAMDYLIQHADIKHGAVKVAFTIDEEIGRGADTFNVEEFGADFAYTMDGGPLGGLEYETFNAAEAKLVFNGISVHPGTAKDTMINANVLMSDFIQQLPHLERPEHTDNYEGFYLVHNMNGEIEHGTMNVIIRDHDKKSFENRKQVLTNIVNDMNNKLGHSYVELDLSDTYYNMRNIIEEDMTPVNLAKDAMVALGIDWVTEPVRGGTDGSRLSYMGLPTPNLFTGGENYHGKHEFVVLETMEKAVETILKIVELNAN